MITLYDIKKLIYKFIPNKFEMLENKLLAFENLHKDYFSMGRHEYLTRTITYHCYCGAAPLSLTFDELNEWASNTVSLWSPSCPVCDRAIPLHKKDWLEFIKTKKAYSKQHLTQSFPYVPSIYSNYRADILDTVEIPYTEPEEWWPEPVKEIFRKNNANYKR